MHTQARRQVTDPTSPSRRPVQSVARALGILEALADAGRALGISEIAERVDLPLPTIHRLLHTLIDAGYMFQTPRRQYALSARLIGLSRYAGDALGMTLRPHLAQVVDAAQESASIAMLDQDFARYIAHVPAAHSMRMFTEVGNQVSLHSTGVGKAILSLLPESRARALLTGAPLRWFTPHTITDPDELMAEVAAIRSRGYALDREEHEIGVCCIAVPVPAQLPLAISVSGPHSRLTDEDVQSKALPALREAVREISPLIELAMTGS